MIIIIMMIIIIAMMMIIIYKIKYIFIYIPDVYYILYPTATNGRYAAERRDRRGEA